MDVLVLLDDCDDELAGRAPAPGAPVSAGPLAYVHSAPDQLAWTGRFGGRGPTRGREVVTLCGVVDADRLALALAAVVEGRRAGLGPPSAVRHLGVWNGLGAIGDTAWRDRTSGQLLSHDLAISPGVLEATARQLLHDAGRLIRQTAAELSTPEWPEGARRAISFTLPVPGDAWAARRRAPAGVADEVLLASLREADAEAYGEPFGEPAEAIEVVDERVA